MDKNVKRTVNILAGVAVLLYIGFIVMAATESL